MLAHALLGLYGERLSVLLLGVQANLGEEKEWGLLLVKDENGSTQCRRLGLCNWSSLRFFPQEVRSTVCIDWIEETGALL